MRRASHRPGIAVSIGLLAVAACTSARGTGGTAFDPRFVAVHNTLAAMGLVQVGLIHEGLLGEARDAKVSLDLPAGWVTILAIGGEGVHDIDATLLDPRGAPIAHDTTSEPQAVLRLCLDAADTYAALVVRVSSGAGPWVVATWVGAATGGAPMSPAAGSQAAPEARGTCEAPIPLVPGTVSASTRHGEHENAGSCSPSDSRELVYELNVTQRQRMAIEVEAHFDSGALHTQGRLQ